MMVAPPPRGVQAGMPQGGSWLSDGWLNSPGKEEEEVSGPPTEGMVLGSAVAGMAGPITVPGACWGGGRPLVCWVLQSRQLPLRGS